MMSDLKDLNWCSKKRGHKIIRGLWSNELFPGSIQEAHLKVYLNVLYFQKSALTCDVVREWSLAPEWAALSALCFGVPFLDCLG